jgi:hypothetical protein
MLLTGYVQNGEIVLDQPAELPDGTRVRVHILSAEGAEPPTPYERLEPFIGCLKHLPEDAAHNHDHYLYGAPKKP